MAQNENAVSRDFTVALHHCMSLSKQRDSSPALFGYPHPGTWHMHKQDGCTAGRKLPRVKTRVTIGPYSVQPYQDPSLGGS